MSIDLWSQPFANITGAGSTVAADFLNYVRLNLPNAIDGAHGGAYSPDQAINIIGGFGLLADKFALNDGGVLTVPAGATLTLAGTENVENGGTLRAKSGATIELQMGSELLGTGGNLTFTDGVVDFGGVTVVQIDHVLDAISADINFDSGTLWGDASTSLHSGLWAWTSGAVVQVATGAEFDVNGGATMGLSGVMTVTSSGEIHGEAGALALLDQGSTLDVHGAVEIRGTSIVTVHSGADIASTGAAIDISGGTVHVGAAAVTIDNNATIASARGVVNTNDSQEVRTGPTNYIGNDAYNGERLNALTGTSGPVDAYRHKLITLTGPLGGDITWTLQTPPLDAAANQMKFVVRFFFPVSLFSGHSITIKDAAGNTIDTLIVGSFSKYRSFEVAYIGLTADTWTKVGDDSE